MRGVQVFPPEQGADAARLFFGLIGFLQDALLVLAREDAALGFGDDLGIRVADADRGRSGLASLGLTTALYSQGRRVCLLFFMLNFLPALLFKGTRSVSAILARRDTATDLCPASRGGERDHFVARGPNPGWRGQK
jgi:hypothetical protein